MSRAGMSRSVSGANLARAGVAGFGLVELMIAMVLSLILLGAAFAIFMSSQRTFLASEGINRIQENARVAFELMSRDIRAAGGSACSSASTIEDTGTNSLNFRNAPIDTHPEGGFVARSGEDMAYRVANSTSSQVTLDAGVDVASAFAVNDVLLLCNARKTYVVQATGVNAATNTVTFATLPGNYVPTADEFAPPMSVVLARYRDVRWFADDNGRGGESLYVSRMGAAREEVAEGVEGLALEYLDGREGTYGATPDADTVAVRMTMTLRGQDIGGQPLTRTVSNVVTLRGRTL